MIRVAKRGSLISVKYLAEVAWRSALERSREHPDADPGRLFTVWWDAFGADHFVYGRVTLVRKA